MAQRIITGALILLASFGCDSRSRSVKPEFDKELNAQLIAIASMLPKVESTVVHEGLPHPVEAAFKTERQRTDAIQIDGYMFYEPDVSIQKPEENELNLVLSNPKTYKRWLGEKLCDGFHPDWSIDWDIDHKRMRFLLCFGCDEIKVVFPDKEWRFDMSDGARTKLKSILFPHHVNLPQESRNPY